MVMFMKKNLLSIVEICLFTSILMFVMISTFFKFIIPVVKENLLQKDDGKVIKVNYKELYPFETKNKKKKQDDFLSNYSSHVKEIEKSLEDYTSTKVFGYIKSIELSYIYDHLLAFKLKSNFSNTDRIVVDNEYLSRLYQKQNVSSCANNILKFNSFLKENNIPLLFVHAPSKLCNNQLNSYIYKDYSDVGASDFLNYIEKDIDYIDLRKNISKVTTKPLKLYFKTDHHWLPETGFWVTNELSDYIINNYGFALNKENIEKEKYKKKVYPNIFFGSDGRNVSLSNASPEDFSVITPNFKTSLNVKIANLGIDRNGSFHDTLINWDLLKYVYYYESNQYAAYAYGDQPLINIHNNYVSNGKKILLIKDSFSDVVSPYLAMEVENLSIIDLRYFDGSLKNYVTKYQPDLVLVMYNTSSIVDIEKTNTEGFNDLWDFE